MMSDIDRLKEAARGERSDYRLEHRPLSQEGGQAVVFRAVHKTLGLEVAFKKLRDRTADATARMGREVFVGEALWPRSYHVMPVVDSAADNTWFVMPLAEGSALDFAATFRGSQKLIRELVEETSSALKSAHEMDWIHRDVKPPNILRLKGESGERWVLADWGLGRRPRGETSQPGRTKIGVSYGTEGFAAPELSSDAHAATAAADIYSLGQVIGWALTGNWPQANVPLLPKSGAWRQVIKEATRYEASRRPQSIEDLLDLIANELDEPPVPPSSKGEELLAAAKRGDANAATQLLALAGSHPDDVDLYLDVLPQLGGEDLRQAARADPSVARDVADGLRENLSADWGRRDFDWANSIIRVCLNLAREGALLSNLDLLEAAADALFAWDDDWDRWPVQKDIRTWLESLRGENARVVASAIRPFEDSKRHFEELADRQGVDTRISAVLKHHP